MKPKKIKVLKAVSGFFGRRNNCFAIAIRAAHRAWSKAYEGRKHRKRDFRELWIAKINAGARQHGMAYATFMKSLPLAGLSLNRKVLAEIAVTEPYSFKAVVEAGKLALKESAKAPVVEMK
jgi:large subunit ribosomal protein L20